MKERPILFSTPMVRALLEGRKTQTRRVVKFPHQNPLGEWEPIDLGGPGCYLDKACTQPDPEPPRTFMWHTRTADMVACPYGKAGDRLWVRETWMPAIDAGGPDWRYAADYDEEGRAGMGDLQRWRPSIHMTRRASRITLEITVVRVERLQAISDADAIAEGIERVDDLHGTPLWRLYGKEPWNTVSPVESYTRLWDEINGAGAWAANPWVWVVEFKRVDADGERAAAEEERGIRDARWKTAFGDHP